MVTSGLESSEVYYHNNRVLNSPTKSKGRGPKNPAQSPRGKRVEFYDDAEKIPRVKPGGQGYNTPVQRSPQGKNRGSPSRDRSPRLSPSHLDYYAGFGDSPAPTALPKPPSHWMAPVHISPNHMSKFLNGPQCQSLSCSFQDFKMLLKAQA